MKDNATDRGMNLFFELSDGERELIERRMGYQWGLIPQNYFVDFLDEFGEYCRRLPEAKLAYRREQQRLLTQQVDAESGNLFFYGFQESLGDTLNIEIFNRSRIINGGCINLVTRTHDESKVTGEKLTIWSKVLIDPEFQTDITEAMATQFVADYYYLYDPVNFFQFNGINILANPKSKDSQNQSIADDVIRCIEFAETRFNNLKSKYPLALNELKISLICTPSNYREIIQNFLSSIYNSQSSNYKPDTLSSQTLHSRVINLKRTFAEDASQEPEGPWESL
jgi:hypothetical protein